MPTLSTGLVLVGAYSDKVRKTLFAQFSEEIKKNEINPQEIARASAELNRALYRLIVDELSSDKGDIVRIKVDYSLEAGKIIWKYDTLKVEYFKRVADTEIAKRVEAFKSRITEILAEKPQYELKPLAFTILGENIIEVNLKGKRIGVIGAQKVNNMVFVRGASIYPQSMILRARIQGEGEIIDILSKEIANIIASGESVDPEKAERAIEALEDLAKKEAEG
ncbi:hypothetical protein HRbin06_00521 [archaeon HR06]|nr:hypothetical protein HRbin06_00521 [archaeon HR06]